MTSKENSGPGAAAAAESKPAAGESKPTGGQQGRQKAIAEKDLVSDGLCAWVCPTTPMATPTFLYFSYISVSNLNFFFLSRKWKLSTLKYLEATYSTFELLTP